MGNPNQRSMSAHFVLIDSQFRLQFVYAVGGSSPDGGDVKREAVGDIFVGGFVENWIAAGEVTGHNSERFSEIEGGYSMGRRCGCGDDVVAEMIIGGSER